MVRQWVGDSDSGPLLTFANTGLTLVASVDDQQMQELAELKQNVRSIIKKLTPNSEPRASIESSKHTMQ